MKNRKKIDQKIQALLHDFSGMAGIAVKGINHEYSYRYQENQVMSTASTAKVFILGTLLELCNHKICSLTHQITVHKRDLAEGSGVLKSLAPDTILTVYDIAMLMIIVSDNTATNLLIDYVGGTEVIENHLKRYGIYASRVNRKISENPVIVAGSNFGDATAQDFVDYLWKIRNGCVLGEANQKIFWDMMSRQLYKDMLPGNMPVLDYPAEVGSIGVHVANKTGFMSGIRCDIGIFRMENKKEYTYAVLTNGCKDLRECTRNEANVLLTDIGTVFYEELSK